MPTIGAAKTKNGDFFHFSWTLDYGELPRRQLVERSATPVVRPLFRRRSRVGTSLVRGIGRGLIEQTAAVLATAFSAGALIRALSPRGGLELHLALGGRRLGLDGGRRRGFVGA